MSASDLRWYRAAYTAAAARMHAILLWQVEHKGKRQPPWHEEYLTEALTLARHLVATLVTPVEGGGERLDRLRAEMRDPAVLMLAGGIAFRVRGIAPPHKERFRFGDRRLDDGFVHQIVDDDLAVLVDRTAYEAGADRLLVRSLGPPRRLAARARYNLACYLATAGYHDDAVEQLCSAWPEVGRGAPSGDDPTLAPIRKHPGFPKSAEAAQNKDAPVQAARTASAVAKELLRLRQELDPGVQRRTRPVD